MGRPYEFPDPNFRRAQWIDLNGPWEFSFDQPTLDRTIEVPFCYQSPRSGIGCTEPHSILWYRRCFDYHDDGQALLHFGAVDYQAWVYLNGQFIGCHEGGYAKFTFPVGDILRQGDNELLVRVVDTLSVEQPRGKQSWTGSPFKCWYTAVSGIWQSVWIEPVSSGYIESAKLTPDWMRMCAEVAITIAGEATQVRAEAFLSRDGRRKDRIGTLQADVVQGVAHGVMALMQGNSPSDGELAWTPETPNLIEVEITLVGVSDVLDVVQTHFGLRSVETRGNRIFLNGSECYQRLLLDQGYYPDSLLTPPDDARIREDILLIKRMGFNGVRKHQVIDPRFCYWADRLGLLVWGEMPSAYRFSDAAMQNTHRDATRMVLQSYNHPSIIVWVPFNESWGVSQIYSHKGQQDFVRSLYHWIRSLDPTRLVSSNDGWEQLDRTDLCSIHDYMLIPANRNKYDDMDAILAGIHPSVQGRSLFVAGSTYGNQPILISEYGGIAFVSDDEKNWGYLDAVESPDEWRARLAPVTEAIRRNPRICGFCYTQFTDVMQEQNGLLTLDRQFKIPLSMIQEIFCG